MDYSISKALACQRWDLIVNGIVIETARTRRELVEFTINPLVNKGLLLEEVKA